MSAVADILKRIGELPRGDQEYVLTHLYRVADSGEVPGHPGVRKTPGVCGGEACVGNTRIMVWLLDSLRRQGMTDRSILDGYPQLRAEDLRASWRYAADHADELTAAAQTNRDA